MGFINQPILRQSKIPLAERYCDYLQNQDYVNQITNCADRNAAMLAIQSREIKEAVINSTSDNSEIIERTSAAIRDSIERGFEDVTDAIGIGFSLVAENQKITNRILGEIKDILRIPDRQKDRLYYIEEGIKYLSAASGKPIQSEYYLRALDKFKQALDIEKEDFLSLYYIGFLQLYTPQNINFASAEKHLRQAGFFYRVQAEAGEITSVAKNLRNNRIDFWLETKNAFFHAAWACCMQAKYSEAASLAAEAWEAYPRQANSGFMQAKYLVLDKDIRNAVVVLEKVIRQTAGFFYETLADPDLNKTPEILTLLDKLHAELKTEVYSKLNYWRKIITPIWQTSGSKINLEEIHEKIKSDNYVALSEAKQLMATSLDWVVAEGASFDSQGRILPKISKQPYRGSLIDIAKFETERILAIPISKILIEIENVVILRSPLEVQLKEFKKEYKDKVTRVVSGVAFLVILYFVQTALYDYAHGGTANGVGTFFSTIVIFCCKVFFFVMGVMTIASTVMLISKWIKVTGKQNEIDCLDTRVNNLQQDALMKEQLYRQAIIFPAN